jgi:pimeloyl-ACP methyl ester carboxylesterase
MKNLLVVHGGPGLSNDYIIPSLANLEGDYKIIHFNYELISPANLGSVISQFDNILSTLDLNNTIILAHSFGAIIVLAHFRTTKIIVEKYIFSNWIYNYDWLNDFILNNKAYLDANYNNSTSLKARMLSIVDLYFDDHHKGTSTLESLNYFDFAFESLNNEAKSLSFTSEVQQLASKIISISCLNDRIVSFKYIDAVVEKYKIKSIVLSNGAHFPFLQNKSLFFDKLNHVLEHWRTHES